MHKILILSLLVVLFAVPVIAETEKPFEERQREAEKLANYFAYTIESLGWKCGKVRDTDVGQVFESSGKEPYAEILKVVCINNLIYYFKTTKSGNTVCHKGRCLDWDY